MTGGENSGLFIMLHSNALFRMKGMKVLVFHQHSTLKGKTEFDILK